MVTRLDIATLAPRRQLRQLMKAMVIEGDSGIDGLRMRERPIPVAGATDIVIRVRAAALNYRDLEIVRGSYAVRYQLPLVPLSDGVGEVVKVGDQVTRFKVGDRVLGTFWQNWIAGDSETPSLGASLGGPLDGMLQEYVRLTQDGAVPAPRHLSDAEAATLPCAGLTAWHALVTEGRLKAGDSVLIQGTGGVSTFALQFAVMFGARAIVISSNPAKLERARELGASDAINYAEQPDWPAEVRRATNGRGVDHVLDVGGPGTMAKSLEAVRLGGQVSVIGYLGGKGGEINPLRILQKRVTVRGIPVGSRESFEAMNRGLQVRDTRPVVDRVFPWTEAPAAFRYLADARHFGKVVLSLDDTQE